MTLDPNDAHQPAWQEQPQQQPQPPAPQHPARPKGLAGALTAAIIVSVLPIIAIPAFIIWSFAVVFDYASSRPAAAVEVEADERADSTLSADIPADLPWDVRLGGDALTWMVDSFPSDPAWEVSGEPNEPDRNFTNIAYANSETGCYVWFANGPLEAIDVTHGDRVASIGLFQYALELEVSDDEARDGSIATVSADGTQPGSTDAVEIDLDDQGWTGVAVSRAFPSIGEGVVYTVECPDEAQLDDARAQVDELLQLALTPTH